MVCIAVRMRKSSMSHLGHNMAPKRMNTLSVKYEHADLKDLDVSSTKDLIFETES